MKLLCLAVLFFLAASQHVEGSQTEDSISLLKKLLNWTSGKRSLAISETSLHSGQRRSAQAAIERRSSGKTYECKAQTGQWRLLRLTNFMTGALQTQSYGSGDYMNTANCQWVVCVPAGRVVRLTFKGTFEIEGYQGNCRYDVLSIYDGSATSDRKLGDFCGSTAPGPLTSSGNCVNILFKADGSSPRSGFKVQFDAVFPASSPTQSAPTTRRPLPGSSHLNPANCGTNRFARRILNGDASKHGEWPWIAHVRTYTSQTSYMQCGGSLLNNQWVVTAAHCIEYGGHWITNPGNFEVYLGEHNLDSKDYSERQVTVSKVIKHPLRTQQGVNPYDIALIKLSSPIAYNDYINAVCMPTYSGEFPAGTDCFTSGWGKTHTHSSTSSELLHIEMDIISNTECAYSYGRKVGSDVICAKKHGHIMSACQGDSGGPLVCKRNGVYTLAGVVSFGTQCGTSASATPTVYASTEYFKQWIINTMNDN